MFYELNQGKGTLMYSAKNSKHGYKWRRREPVDHVALRSLAERDVFSCYEMVEKGGTGIKRDNKVASSPLMNVNALGSVAYLSINETLVSSDLESKIH